ncbi:MAG: FtsW/RodA/SpoVE family cell cycle protein [Lentisphaeria bacterium]|nr:FtsW/RodA/SpoVE family cell cycle protein [Lentisphaeria bacterium]
MRIFPKQPSDGDLPPPRLITLPGAICVFLGLFGCLAIFNATFHLDTPFLFLTRQLVWLTVGTAVLIIATAIPSRMHKTLLPVYVLLAYIPLILVLFYGVRINSMRGWFAIRTIFYQPSETAKPIFVLVLAWVLGRTQAHRREFVKGFLPALAVLVLWAIPIILQPDFGSLLVYGLTFCVLVLCAGTRVRHLSACAPVLVIFLIWVLITHPYVAQRMAGFFNPEKYPDSYGWHIIQFHRSLASGGLFGKSWGEGVWSQTHLPLGYSDSIFATLGEAIGFIGLCPFVGLIVVWTVYGYRRTQGLADAFAAMSILGLTACLSIQAFIHLSVNLALLPPTGITLPLVSYGGSSLLSAAITVGLVESFARGKKRFQ